MRRIVANSDFRAGFVEMMPANLGLVPFGLVCGVGAASAGVSIWAALGLSAIVFSGAAQVLAVQLLAADAPVAVIVLTCFVAGLRFLMYSAAMAPYLRPLPQRWQQSLAFLLTDQAFASAIRRFDAANHPREGALHFLGGGLALWSCWQLSNLVGYFAGNLIPATWSLDFAVPLCFLALVAPLLRDAPNVVAASVAAVAVMAFAGLPMKLNLIVAGVIGIVAGTVADALGNRELRA
ncbi:MAG TPA: AzlC family ABC transporter permease [Casimicrobiaceae bacterium]|nr:AzlC family ABC transporter permease [Casimicrobiaceae bacterium]